MSTSDTATGPAPARSPRGTRRRGAVAGLVAAAAGVLAGEGVSALLTGVTAPVVAVGNRAIDWTPRPLKEWAIETLGMADKAVLIGGVLVTVGLLAMAAGITGARRRAVGLGMLTLLVAIASAAVLTDRAAGAGTVLRVVPVATMAVVGIGGLWWMLRTLRPTTADATTADATTADPTTTDATTAAPPAAHASAERAPGRTRVLLTDDMTGQEVPPGFNRRGFLQAAGTVAAVGAVGGAGARLGAGPAASGARDTLSLPSPAEAAPPVPAGVTFEVPGLTPYLSTNADFYRVDTALTVPDVPLEGYLLRIHGMVDTPLELSFADLLKRRLVERRITLTCVSNPVGGDLVDNATWLGIPIRDLLEEAGVRAGADAVKSTSADSFTAAPHSPR